MRFINRVDISVTWSKRTIHIVGLDFDEHNVPLPAHIQIGNGINDNIKGHHISMRYLMNTGTWECGSDLNENPIASACSNGMLTLD